jgi:phenylalanine-4-hydroxylase
MEGMKCILLNFIRHETFGHYSLLTDHAVAFYVQLVGKVVGWKIDCNFIILFRIFLLSADKIYW